MKAKHFYFWIPVMALSFACNKEPVQPDHSNSSDQLESRTGSILESDNFVDFMTTMHYGLFARIIDSNFTGSIDFSQAISCLDNSNDSTFRYCLTHLSYYTTNSEINIFFNEMSTYASALRNEFSYLNDSTFSSHLESATISYFTTNYIIPNPGPNYEPDPNGELRCYEEYSNNMANLRVTTVSMLTGSKGWGAMVRAGAYYLTEAYIYKQEYCDCLATRYNGGC